MTPEQQRAIKVLNDWLDGGKLSTGELQRLIAVAIHDAAAIAREECAKLCDEITDREAARMGLMHHEHLTGRQCANAIRLLNKESDANATS